MSRSRSRSRTSRADAPLARRSSRSHERRVDRGERSSRKRDYARSPVRRRSRSRSGSPRRRDIRRIDRRSRSRSIDRERRRRRRSPSRSPSRSASPRVPRRYASNNSSSDASDSARRRRKDARKKSKSKKSKKEEKSKKPSTRSFSASPTRLDANEETEGLVPDHADIPLTVEPTTTETSPPIGAENDAKDFFARLKQQEAAKQSVGTLHASGVPQQTALAANAGQWECAKGGCGHQNAKYAAACSKCGGLKRMSEWR